MSSTFEERRQYKLSLFRIGGTLRNRYNVVRTFYFSVRTVERGYVIFSIECNQSIYDDYNAESFANFRNLAPSLTVNIQRRLKY
jgi:hypothetical protein